MTKGRDNGELVEEHVRNLLDTHNISFETADTYYDLLIEGRHELEIKGTSLTIKRGEAEHNKGFYRIGRFEFSKDQLQSLKEANAWVCLVIYHGEEYILLGFVKAKGIRHLKFSIHTARSLKLMELKLWKGIMKADKSNWDKVDDLAQEMHAENKAENRGRKSEWKDLSRQRRCAWRQKAKAKLDGGT